MSLKILKIHTSIIKPRLLNHPFDW